MPWYPKAVHRPITSGTDGPMAAHVGAVLHVNESDGNLFGWVNGGTHDMSCHFEVYKTGVIEQYLDTAVDSWCQMDGNETYVSIETEGYATEALTGAQVASIAGLMLWLHQVHGIPLQLADQPGQRGLGWHGMGGAAWGGHTGCPGDLRKAQRPLILHLAATGALDAPGAPPAIPSNEETDVYVNLAPGAEALIPIAGLKRLLLSAGAGGASVRAETYDAAGGARALVTRDAPISKSDRSTFWLHQGQEFAATIPPGARSVSITNLGKHALGVRAD